MKVGSGEERVVHSTPRVVHDRKVETSNEPPARCDASES